MNELVPSEATIARIDERTIAMQLSAAEVRRLLESLTVKLDSAILTIHQESFTLAETLRKEAKLTAETLRLETQKIANELKEENDKEFAKLVRKEEFLPVRNIVYGMVAIMLTTILAALFSLIIKTPGG